jgi:long-chain acyl-CoA synthetase
MKTIFELIRNISEQFPEKKAIICGSDSITYQELIHNSNSVSGFLQEKIKKSDVVSILSENSINFVVTYLGIINSGNIVHIIPPNISEINLNYQIQQTKPKILFVSDSLKKKAIRSEILESTIIESMNIKEKFSCRNLSNNICSIIFTSGTSGKSKGVKIKHQNILHTTKNITDFLGINEKDIEVNPLQLSHSFGLGCMHATLSKGATSIIFQNTINLKNILIDMKEKKATGFVGVPIIFRSFLENYKEDFFSCNNNLRYMLTNSAPMPKKLALQLLEIFPKTQIYTYYGLTEASRSTFLRYNDDIDKIESVGRHANGVEIKIVDEDGKKLLFLNKGEIMIRGQNVIEQYWNNPKLDTNIVDGWLKTGDTGHFDQEDFLYIDGRSDDMINISGEKASPYEIENVIKQIDTVTDVGVVGVMDDVFGQIPIAFIVKNEKLSEDDVIHFCRAKLEGYKIPQKIIFIENMPKNESDKILRSKLRKMYQNKKL